MDRRNFLKSASLSGFGLFLDPKTVFSKNSNKNLQNSFQSLINHEGPHDRPSMTDQKHLLWVWQFSEDGSKYAMRDHLAKYNLGVVMKTHDGTEWMSNFDPSPDAIDGPEKIHELAQFFESAGVPFHTWSVPHGIKPIQEAEMTVLAYNAGSRSIFLDVEHTTGFWRGTNQSAHVFGEKLRNLSSDMRITTSIDGRPWNIDAIPIDAFAEFSDALAPQLYWETFRTWGNRYHYNDHGYFVPNNGISPSFIIQSAFKKLSKYNIAIEPVGEGSSSNVVEWSEFIQAALARNAETVSAWRYGTTSTRIMKLMSNNEPLPKFYTVISGDSLYYLSSEWGVSTQTIVNWNPDLNNPNMLSIGQVLRIPDGDHPMQREVSHTIQNGENLSIIAENWGVDMQKIIDYNQILNPHQIYVGDSIKIPINDYNRQSTSSIKTVITQQAHKVVPGDNLWDLSQRWNVSIQKIIDYNKLSNSNLIRIGTILKKP
tara:strand:- start:46 stop:1494 length:1449 start_codon:yes stop_codon:yes gene_type:complete